MVFSDLIDKWNFFVLVKKYSDQALENWARRGKDQGVDHPQNSAIFLILLNDLLELEKVFRTLSGKEDYRQEKRKADKVALVAREFFSLVPENSLSVSPNPSETEVWLLKAEDQLKRRWQAKVYLTRQNIDIDVDLFQAWDYRFLEVHFFAKFLQIFFIKKFVQISWSYLKVDLFKKRYYLYKI